VKEFEIKTNNNNFLINYIIHLVTKNKFEKYIISLDIYFILEDFFFNFINLKNQYFFTLKNKMFT